MGHDKIHEIGEELHPEEAALVLHYVSSVLLPERPDIAFPGSQPVSLDRNNLAKIYHNRCRGVIYHWWGLDTTSTRDMQLEPSITLSKRAMLNAAI